MRVGNASSVRSPPFINSECHRRNDLSELISKRNEEEWLHGRGTLFVMLLVTMVVNAERRSALMNTVDAFPVSAHCHITNFTLFSPPSSPPTRLGCDFFSRKEEGGASWYTKSPCQKTPCYRLRVR